MASPTTTTTTKEIVEEEFVASRTTGKEFIAWMESENWDTVLAQLHDTSKSRYELKEEDLAILDRDYDKNSRLASMRKGDALRIALTKGAPASVVQRLLQYMSMLSHEQLVQRNNGNNPFHMVMTCEKAPTIEVIRVLKVHFRKQINKDNKNGLAPAHFASRRDDIPADVMQQFAMDVGSNSIYCL